MFRDMLPEDIITGGFFRIFVYAFAWSNMTAGPLMAFGYKEITNSGEYYFYYNRAISKIQLFAYCFIMNILLGIAIFTVQSYVASA